MIAILQPLVPHYRADFFDGLKKLHNIDIYTYENNKEIKKRNFKLSNNQTIYLNNFKIGSLLFYNPFPFLSSKYKVLILMGSVKHISTWLILFLNIFLNKKIILFGHGISYTKYEKEKLNQPFYRKLLYKMSDIGWFYTKHEARIWKNEIQKLKCVSLNNTVSGIDRIISQNLLDKQSRDIIKDEFNINKVITLIICVRFENPHRQTDKLIELFKLLPKDKYNLIVIGEGKYKPDFSSYKNIYDFGTTYDLELKNKLFSISDLYIQPAAIGLSCVEAMAYGLPVCTLNRTPNNHQGVEYNYLINGVNSIVEKNILDMYKKIITLSLDNIDKMKMDTKNFSKINLSMKDMVKNAHYSLKDIM